MSKLFCVISFVLHYFLYLMDHIRGLKLKNKVYLFRITCEIKHFWKIYLNITKREGFQNVFMLQYHKNVLLYMTSYFSILQYVASLFPSFTHISFYSKHKIVLFLVPCHKRRPSALWLISHFNNLIFLHSLGAKLATSDPALWFFPSWKTY